MEESSRVVALNTNVLPALAAAADATAAIVPRRVTAVSGLVVWEIRSA
jgi:hypothetical protein